MVRQQWMDGLRGLAVVAVVVLHAEYVAGPWLWLSSVNQHLQPLRMPLLMGLSGMLVARSLARGPRRHVEGKVRSVLWPYVVWASLDLGQVVAACSWAGEPLPDDLGRLLIYNPSGYLWFLAFLFCFHLLVTPMPAWLRTVAGPVLLLAAGHVSSHDLHRFVWLFGWFLVGDLLARLVGPRLHLEVGRWANRLPWGVFAVVGRQSVVYYACHLIVMVYAIRVAHAVSVSDPRFGVAVAVVVPLATGALLVLLRRHRWVDALFVLPRVDFTAVPDGALYGSTERQRD